jgi:hypothetical protein
MPYNSHSARGKNKSAHHTNNFQLTQNCSWVYKDQSNHKLCRYLYRPSSVCLYRQASKMNHRYSTEFLHRKSPSITSKEGMMTFPPAFTHTVSVFYQISNFQQLGLKRPETLDKPNNIFVKFPLKINIIGLSRCKKSPPHMLPRMNSCFRYYIQASIKSTGGVSQSLWRLSWVIHPPWETKAGIMLMMLNNHYKVKRDNALAILQV